MEEGKIRQIKAALLKCAKENENKVTPTFNEVVSRLCEDAELRIRELEEENKKLNEKLSEISECFISASYTDDYEMMNAGREIHDIFYPEKKSYRESTF